MVIPPLWSGPGPHPPLCSPAPAPLCPAASVASCQSALCAKVGPAGCPSSCTALPSTAHVLAPRMLVVSAEILSCSRCLSTAPWLTWVPCYSGFLATLPCGFSPLVFFFIVVSIHTHPYSSSVTVSWYPSIASSVISYFRPCTYRVVRPREEVQEICSVDK